jgi:polar amino acid transport system permease protein
MTAARALGISQGQAVSSIVLPQALRLVLPAWSNEVVAMLKFAAVVFLIAVPDLMGRPKFWPAATLSRSRIYLIVAVFYIVLVGITYGLLRQLERRLRVPGLTGEAT